MEKWSSTLDFGKLRKEFGSPLYIFNSAVFIQNFNDFSCFTAKEDIYFPIKANPHPRLIQLLISLGAGLDCASKYEIDLALHSGANWESIIYNSPVLNASLAIEALAQGGKVVVNSVEIFKKLESALTHKYRGSLFLRWNPSVEIESPLNHMMAHGSSQSKFGMTSAEILAICSNTKLSISGIHTHIGSRIKNLDLFAITIDKLHELSDKIKQCSNQQIRYLNLGGGLGIDLNGKSSYPSIKEFTSRLNPLKQDKYVYCLEPGNALAGQSIGLLCSILEIKQSQNKKWGFLDVGTNQLVNWIALQSPHRILRENKEALPFEGPDSLGGPLCFAGDVLLHHTDLTGLEVNAPLFIQHCGSYCYAIGNHFNGFLSPGWVEVDLKNDSYSLIQSEECAKFISLDSKLKVIFDYSF